jgi:hypothetical protein
MAQESINAGGSDIVEQHITFGYSVGQVFYEAVFYDEGSLIPGVRQIPESGFANGNPEPKTDLQIHVYPNPATDHLVLSFPEYKTARHTMTLLDLTGIIICRDKIKNDFVRLDVQVLTSGIYFLQIADEEQIIKAFKIIKK